MQVTSDSRAYPGGRAAPGFFRSRENMMSLRQNLFTVIILYLVLAFGTLASAQTVNSLPSWNDGKAKQSIVNFVTKVTKQGSPDLVPMNSRPSLSPAGGSNSCVRGRKRFMASHPIR